MDDVQLGRERTTGSEERVEDVVLVRVVRVHQRGVEGPVRLDRVYFPGGQRFTRLWGARVERGGELGHLGADGVVDAEPPVGLCRVLPRRALVGNGAVDGVGFERLEREGGASRFVLAASLFLESLGEPLELSRLLLLELRGGLLGLVLGRLLRGGLALLRAARVLHLALLVGPVSYTHLRAHET